MKLTDNTILVTGGGTGIGRALAAAFLERGNQVIVCGRRQEKLDEARSLHPQLRTYRCDVSNAEDRQRLFASISRDGLSVNALINNAACMRTYDLTGSQALDVDKVRDDLAVNFLAPVAMVDLFLAMLLEHEHPVIVNVCSPGALVPVARVPVYCASKAALASYTRSLRYQLREKVKVVTLYPPSVDTEMVTGVRLRKISVDQCAREMMQRLAGDRDEVWIGEGRYVPMLARLAPNRTFSLVNRATKFS